MTKKTAFDSFVNNKAIELLDVETALSLTGEYIAHVLKNTPQDIREVTGHLSGAMGKGARAKLLLLCAMDSRGVVPVDAVGVAAGIELFHLATLVHDDIIDDSPLRRGIPAVHSRFGKKQAVICGDYILCLAMGLISEIGLRYTGDNALMGLFPEFLAAAQSICLGEHMQSQSLGRLDLTFKGYLGIISGKTAALFYLSAYAGALLCPDLDAGENEREIRHFARFGKYLGIIFQIIDDCKDYEFTEKDALKPVRRDISNGVITLPLILSLRESAAVRALAADVLAGPDELIAEVCREGGVKSAKRTAEGYYRKALRFLDKTRAPETKRDLLAGVLESAYASSKSF